MKSSSVLHAGVSSFSMFVFTFWFSNWPHLSMLVNNECEVVVSPEHSQHGFISDEHD